MKNFKMIFAALVMTGAVLSSCEKDDLKALEVSAAKAMINNTKWKVISYTVDSTDKTFEFSGYEFTFKDDGTSSAVKSGASSAGTWTTKQQEDHVEFVINYGASEPLQELNDDWHIKSQTSNTVNLEDVSGGNGGGESLTFEKL